MLGTLAHHSTAQLRASLRNAIQQLAEFRIADSMGGSLSGLLNDNTDRTLWVRQTSLALFVLALAGAVIANSAFYGATSGAFERYQARVIWLVSMLAALVEIGELSIRSHAAQAAKPVEAD